MARFLAFIFFVFALLRGYFDWQVANLAGNEFSFLPIGQVWFDFHRNSLLSLQPAVERYLSPVIWENILRPITLAPMAPVLLGIAVFAGVIALLFQRNKS